MEVVLMKRKYRNNKQINNAIKSAGKTFLGYQTENVLRSIENGSSMNSIIEELYKNQFGFTDAEIIGTSKRVKALFRIIQADSVIYALSQIDRITFQKFPQSLTRAKETIEKINSGELKLPHLED